MPALPMFQGDYGAFEMAPHHRDHYVIAHFARRYVEMPGYTSRRCYFRARKTRAAPEFTYVADDCLCTVLPTKQRLDCRRYRTKTG